MGQSSVVISWASQATQRPREIIGGAQEADEVGRLKLEKQQQIRELHERLCACNARISRFEELVQEGTAYKSFLEKLSPPVSESDLLSEQAMHTVAGDTHVLHPKRPRLLQRALTGVRCPARAAGRRTLHWGQKLSRQ